MNLGSANYHVAVYGEFGEEFVPGRTGQYFGEGADAFAKVRGSFSIDVGYRHLSGFKAADNINEDRFNAGVNLAVGKRDSVGVNYYRTSGSYRGDSVGVGLTHRF